MVNASTQDNYKILEKNHFIGPAQEQAWRYWSCRLEPEKIIEFIIKLSNKGPLSGKTITITAGPTREQIDPVRFISNSSSGKMGYSIAEAAIKYGAKVNKQPD